MIGLFIIALLIPIGDNMTQLVQFTSYSSTNRFNSCPMAYHLNKQGLHKVTVGTEANYMVWGKAAHAALEAHYGNQDPHLAFSNAYPTDLDPTNVVWSREGGARTIEAYINYYADIDKQWDVLGVEVKDNLIKPTLVLDVVARHLQTGSIYFWDHKFKAKAPFNSRKRYEIDSQISRYTDWVLNQYGDCAGGVVNIIVPGYRQRAYKGEPAGWHWKFERETVSRSPQQLDYWRESQAEWEQLIQFCETSGHYPKHLGYGCPGCEYYEACFSGMDEDVVDTLYTDQPLDSFEVVVEDEGE